ncbi:MAG: hypothetical protein GEU75_02630 [Dehalococcoidia bacterium]|nr:hypothetical protein [Dehalococcoidia bacterium]
MRVPNFSNHLFWGLGAPLLFIVFQFGECLPVDAGPESATNPVGASHEVTAEIDGPSGGEWVVVFSVFSGPNAGMSNFPECEAESEADFDGCLDLVFGEGTDEETVSWDYVSNGESGTDYISVCAFEALQISTLSAETTSALRAQVLDVQQAATDEELEADIDELEAMGCDVLTKTWEGDDEVERRPNVGGVFAGDGGAAERNRARANAAGAAAAAATSPVAPTTAVRPPSTGDAGLAAD